MFAELMAHLFQPANREATLSPSDGGEGLGEGCLNLCGDSYESHTDDPT
jgi:hypothetical protein